MLTVGITGGIGSGKSTVCKIFETLGVPIYYADTRAKFLMEHDPRLIAALKKEFGKDVFMESGQLDRGKLASIVFRDSEKIAILNGLVHPAVAEDSANWVQSQSSAYTIKEAALLFESGSYKQLDLIISVTAPLELRISRVMSRDRASREEVLNRINNQWPQEKKDELANFIIINDGQHPLVPQVLKVHKQLSALKALG